MNTVDYVVIALYLALIVGVGLRAGRSVSTMKGFALGDRRIPWWAVVASILAAEVSAATFLGAPVEGYVTRNFAYAQLGLGMVLGRVVVSALFLRPYFDYGVVSIYELLELRFGTATKNTASALFLLTRTLASGARLYAAALLFVVAWQIATGRHPSTREELLVYLVVLTGIGTLTAIYTTVGGIKAVVWTDLIQTAVMYSCLVLVVVLLLRGIPNGWAGARAELQGPRDLAFFDLGLSRGVRSVLESDYTVWTALIATTVMTMATHGTDQDMVQRALAARDHRQSQRALVLSGVADVPVMLGFLFIGVLLWVFYRAHPDPGLPAKPSEVFAYFILRELPPGTRGLLVAGVLATAMGSLSTAQNALATSFTEDWYAPWAGAFADDARLVRATRRATVVFTVLLVAVGFGTAWAALTLQTRVIPIVLGVFGYTYGSLLGVFLLAAVTRARGSDRGNVVAMLIAIVCVIALRLAAPKLAFPWFVPVGTIVTLAVAAAFRTPEAKVRAAAERLRG